LHSSPFSYNSHGHHNLLYLSFFANLRKAKIETREGQRPWQTPSPSIATNHELHIHLRSLPFVKPPSLQNHRPSRITATFLSIQNLHRTHSPAGKHSRKETYPLRILYTSGTKNHHHRHALFHHQLIFILIFIIHLRKIKQKISIQTKPEPHSSDKHSFHLPNRTSNRNRNREERKSPAASPAASRRSGRWSVVA